MKTTMLKITQAYLTNFAKNYATKINKASKLANFEDESGEALDHIFSAESVIDVLIADINYAFRDEDDYDFYIDHEDHLKFILDLQEYFEKTPYAKIRSCVYNKYDNELQVNCY